MHDNNYIAELDSIFKNDYNGLITLEATVDTGFEGVALDECKEMFGAETPSFKTRGRIFFVIPQHEYYKVHCLRAVDNLFLIGAVISNLLSSTSNEKEADLEEIKTLPDKLEWKDSLKIWKDCVGFNGVLYPSKEEQEEGNRTKIAQLEILKSLGVTDRIAITESLNSFSPFLRYRVTCNRVGTHSFGSMDAAKDFGGRLHDLFNWVIDLTTYNIDVVLNICNNKAYVGLGLTRLSKHRRNITHFGPTTLRATVCYGLLRLASPQPGDIVIDPLCGGGSIPIESALAYPLTYNICGDAHEKAVVRSLNNIDSLGPKKTVPVDVLHWNATKLPLRSSSVDVFVTDLPFGKRSGHKTDNRLLYKNVLLELGRVVRPNTGRAVLLTHDRRTFVRVLPQTQGLWKQTKVLGVNLGGLQAGVFQLLRTSKLL
ncbi:tRNA (guanine(6)-N2)-methyltransferase THUMP3-like [Macrosteles quadrilineatus]|uniref:tRNA (guanine(6)-N2)-methyltransferase THUMP3-like n=1 Tax=Macrosteles quadrilineatus TaxID=74068 RepID=UPI0023E16D35|nr:tRNA (guanine(6)-N2)-methyltransferase THUMP3-like [Macrosteles quadrilineatus]